MAVLECRHLTDTAITTTDGDADSDADGDADSDADGDADSDGGTSGGDDGCSCRAGGGPRFSASLLELLGL